MSASPLLAASMGDPAGIGPEIFLRIWQQGVGAFPFFITGDLSLLSARAKEWGIDTPLASVRDGTEARAVFSRALPVLQIETEELALAALQAAYDAVQRGEAEALITGPVSKENLQQAGFDYAGQTDWLSAQTGEKALMMLACPALRVALATVHIPLAEVSGALAEMGAEGIFQKLAVLDSALRRDFGITKPRLALAALNPHAGENGLLGEEEKTLLAPAIAKAQAEGIAVEGAISADTLFIPAQRERFDAVLCLYHDQALIALKTLDFEHGVNISLGLPLVRTSPDHGTAFDLAAREKNAPPPSLLPMCEAMRLAGEMAIKRRQ